MDKKAFITGISGQDGYFLSKLLLSKGYEVHGLMRRDDRESLGSLSYLKDDERKNIKIHRGDITNAVFIDAVISKERYDEIYHFAAQSSVALSFADPKTTYDINIGGTLNVVDAIKKYSSRSKMYFAATSELYGKSKKFLQTEDAPFCPCSPYGISKLAGFWTVKNYRESHGLFMANGILFNHESEVRGKEFVTRKISLSVARIAEGKQDFLDVGNMDVRRDWGYAADYVEGMWNMLQQEMSDDFILATGKSHTIKEFIEEAFTLTGHAIIWEGEGVQETGRDEKTGRVLVKVNPEYFRPVEVEASIGDYGKARKAFGWEPKTDFNKLVQIMVMADLKNARE